MFREAALVRIALVASLGGCTPLAAQLPPNDGRHDEPAPSGAPRGEVLLVVDLEPGSDCEERFDLALYRVRAIERISWDARHGGCTARRIAVGYLSAAASEAQVMEHVRGIVRRVDVAKGEVR